MDRYWTGMLAGGVSWIFGEDVDVTETVLFASDEVVKSMAKFIRNPSYSAYVRTATAMRKDLWGKKTAIDEQIFNIFEKP